MRRIVPTGAVRDAAPGTNGASFTLLRARTNSLRLGNRGEPAQPSRAAIFPSLKLKGATSAIVPQRVWSLDAQSPGAGPEALPRLLHQTD